ncbi:hypothetical protein QM012_006231 [Aureobasidium pullulans]|uniref:Uncharacterized protein n=1 Tax=Aureobasidium pullulans TaxID=5580 RepID=A0ABR0TS09_AURPU
MEQDQPHPPIFSDIPEDVSPPKTQRARKKDGAKKNGSILSRRAGQGNLRSTYQQHQSSSAIMVDNSSKDRHQNSSSSRLEIAPTSYANVQHVSQPVKSTVGSCAYTVQAVHGILTSAARAGNYDQVAAMRSKYWRKNLRTDQAITIAAEDTPFFDQWNNDRESTAQKQHEQAWIKNYEKLHSDTSHNMPLEKFATLAAISAVLHTRHQPIPSTSLSASTELLDFLTPESRMDVDHVASSASGQDDRSSTNVVGQTALEGRGKRNKKHADHAITIVCHGQPPFVQPVLQLLAEPLYALLGTDKYKAFLQRPESLHLLSREFADVDVRQLADFPTHISSVLQGRPSPQVDMSWLCDPREERILASFARKTLAALKESLRPHPLEPVDEIDCYNASRMPGYSSRYQSSPMERLFSSIFRQSYECCGSVVNMNISGELLHFTHTGEIRPPTSPRCKTCSQEPEVTFELRQAPAFVLLHANPIRAKFNQPPRFEFERVEQLVAEFPLPTYTCCGYIIQELDESFTIFLLSGRDWRRYEHGRFTSLGQNVGEHLIPSLMMYRRD